MNTYALELYERARAIRWKSPAMTRRGGIGGEYSVALSSAMSMSFDVLRDYADGDDIRAIDWKSTARTNRLVVRSYQEQTYERLVVLVDAHERMVTGSCDVLKRGYAAQVGATIAAAALHARVSVYGMWIRDQRMLKASSYQAGREILAHFLQEPPRFDSSSNMGDTKNVIAAARLHGASFILISDGLDQEVYDLARHIGAYGSCTMIRLIDPVESDFPESGVLLSFNGSVPIDVRYRSVRNELRMRLASWYAQQADAVERYGVKCMDYYYANSSVPDFVQACCIQRWR